MEKTKRLKYIDIARGIAMFNIVLGHTISSLSVHSYEVYRFLFFVNVPIFFVLSGYLFHIKEDETFWQFFKNKFLRIMLPYFIWAVIFLIPYFIFGGGVAEQLSQESSFSVWGQIKNILYGNGADNALKQNGPLWFLPALFTIEMLYFAIVKFIKNKRIGIIVFFATLIIGYLSSFFAEKFYLPWGINSALTIGSFFYFGYLLKSWRVFDKLKPNANILLMVVCIILCGIAIYFNGAKNVVWADYQYQNYLLTMLAGFTSAIVIIQISKFIGKSRILECVGINTMSILIFHKIIVVVAQTKLGIFSELLLNSSLALEMTLSLIIAIVATAISVLIGNMLRKICPWSIGEKKKA